MKEKFDIYSNYKQSQKAVTSDLLLFYQNTIHSHGVTGRLVTKRQKHFSIKFIRKVYFVPKAKKIGIRWSDLSSSSPGVKELFFFKLQNQKLIQDFPPPRQS